MFIFVFSVLLINNVMRETVHIRCKNNQQTISVPMGSTLAEVYELLGLNMQYGPISARVNNKVEGLQFRVYNNKDVEFLDMYSSSGQRAYTRTLFFVLCKAAILISCASDGTCSNI